MILTALAALQAQRRRRAQRRRMRAQARVYRPRRDLWQMPDYEVYGNYRFDREAILEITQLLQEDLITPTRRSHALTPLQKVMATLHFLASGSFQRASGGLAGMVQSTMSKCVHQVVPAILRRMSNQFVMPTQEEQRVQAMTDFYNIAGFPRTIGAIDCTHVALQAPHETEHLFRNRKGWHSINVQVIVDAHGLIWHVCAKFPGSCHDSYILRQTKIYQDLEQNVYGDSWLIGE